jgi:hypothetical protein
VAACESLALLTVHGHARAAFPANHCGFFLKRLLLAWVVSFIVWLYKQRKKKKYRKKVAAGLATPKPAEAEAPKEKIVIPPDPAVVLGQRSPGEYAFPDKHQTPSRGNSVPLSDVNGTPRRTSTEQQGPSSLPVVSQPSTDEQEDSERISEEMTVPLRV